METDDLKERKRIDVEDDLRCLRNDFKHYIRSVWLLKNRDDNHLLGLRLGGAAGMSRKTLHDIFTKPTSDLVNRYNLDYNNPTRTHYQQDYAYLQGKYSNRPYSAVFRSHH